MNLWQSFVIDEDPLVALRFTLGKSELRCFPLFFSGGSRASKSITETGYLIPGASDKPFGVLRAYQAYKLIKQHAGEHLQIPCKIIIPNEDGAGRGKRQASDSYRPSYCLVT